MLRLLYVCSPLRARGTQNIPQRYYCNPSAFLVRYVCNCGQPPLGRAFASPPDRPSVPRPPCGVATGLISSLGPKPTHDAGALPKKRSRPRRVISVSWVGVFRPYHPAPCPPRRCWVMAKSKTHNVYWDGIFAADLRVSSNGRATAFQAVYISSNLMIRSNPF